MMTADTDLRIVQILTDGDECLLIDIPCLPAISADPSLAIFAVQAGAA